MKFLLSRLMGSTRSWRLGLRLYDINYTAMSWSFYMFITAVDDVVWSTRRCLDMLPATWLTTFWDTAFGAAGPLLFLKLCSAKEVAFLISGYFKRSFVTYLLAFVTSFRNNCDEFFANLSLFAVGCTYSWANYANTNVENGVEVRGVSGVDGCKVACIANSSCTGFDWTRGQCWMSGTAWSGQRNNGTRNGVQHYDLTRNCPGQRRDGLCRVINFSYYQHYTAEVRPVNSV